MGNGKLRDNALTTLELFLDIDREYSPLITEDNQTYGVPTSDIQKLRSHLQIINTVIEVMDPTLKRILDAKIYCVRENVIKGFEEGLVQYIPERHMRDVIDILGKYLRNSEPQS